MDERRLLRVFVYPTDRDSVLQVTMDDHTNCNTASPIAKFSDGHTVFKFDQSGPYYFISGVAENCHKNEKLIVVVMADRSDRSKQTVPTSSPPSPSAEVPAPSPPPNFEDSPPTGVDLNPVPAPGQESPTNNGGASIDMSVIGSIGTFLGSFILLLVS
ncbi:early nodulin-like protein 3 isoform X2 [Olea europaea var. sylvestris]|uniref:early nodulin-like protein 3 isoform X2 n=1 Tax=Olea europaea var. sylvestris TaxID=158386 RepID=UPI000C1CE40C|nr:early nodulin-like protein 3 isoform X2 [Olea europaea var. sylvestris]